MSDNRQINEEYAKIGQRLIETDEALFHLKGADVSIVYLSSDLEKKDKGRDVLGQCEKIADKYKWGIPADFTITLFEPNMQGKNVERVILHELLHVGIAPSGEFFVRPHDVEDFKVLIDRYGTDWADDDGVKIEFEEFEVVMD